ncbi:MAG: GNAT family N-acetyltransferase [Bryobacterales bacterium]|jgi:predicted GNAT superfamily acetyltransferase|nr:GNAT family N-acetyltransferase [Bryobacterales bacterium]
MSIPEGVALEIRELQHREEFEQAVELQRQIWGFSDLETIPVRFFVVASKIGGQVFAAFDGARMVAFLLAVPGIKSGGQHRLHSLTYLHSHMLGVLPEYRDHGLGRRLKLHQREHALRGGFSLIEWTFDPLEPRNAFFNIQRLGAIVRRYVENQYGRTSSTLHTGLPTDRFVAEWWIQSERVSQAIAGQAPLPAHPVQRQWLPVDIETLRRAQPERARDVQRSLAEACHGAFAQGLAITGFQRNEDCFHYLFSEFTLNESQ